MLIRSHHNGLRAALLLSMAIVLLTACAESKTAQCQKLIGIIRQVAQESETYRQSTETDSVLKMADNFEQAAQSVAKLKMSDPQLTDFQAAYGEIYRTNAEATRKFIAALLKKDIITARTHLKQVQDVGDREKSLREELTRHCQP
jgi:capsule polysaccharide export protein KpsE/RkpR